MDDEDSYNAVLDGSPFVRRLVYHPESDCLFEIRTEQEWKSCAENGCDDVTEIEEFEKLFTEQEAQKIKARENDPEIKVQ